MAAVSRYRSGVGGLPRWRFPIVAIAVCSTCPLLDSCCSWMASGLRFLPRLHPALRMPGQTRTSLPIAKRTAPVSLTGLTGLEAWDSVSEEKYVACIRSLSSELDDASSPLPEFLKRKGIQVGEQSSSWSVGRHFLLLGSEPGKGVLGWAWFDEEPEWWNLQNIWVSAGFRRAGLGSYILRYIESATQFPRATRSTPNELRLTALGDAEEFYERIGFPRLGGVCFGKELTETTAEFETTHHASRLWRAGPGDDENVIPMPTPEFRLHVLSMPLGNSEDTSPSPT